MPPGQYRTATGTHFKCAGVTVTGLQARVPACFHHLKSNVALAALRRFRGSVCMCDCVCIRERARVRVLVCYEWAERWHASGTGFATLFDHCKHEFRLFLYRELK